MLNYIIPTLSDKLDHYKLIDDITKGGWKLKEQGELYLTKEDGESPQSYSSRLNKATFFDSFNPTIEGIVGLIFKNSSIRYLETPSQLEPTIENADATGNHFDLILQNMFDMALRKSVSFALVDMPKSDGIRLKKDEKALGIKPYIKVIEPENITSWKTEQIKGQVVLTQVKIKEAVEIPDPDNIYANKSVTQYRILTIGGYQLFQVIDGKELLVEEGTTGLNMIPLVCLNLSGKEFFSGMPPYLELAHLNIAHYQIFTDSRHSAHIASVPMLKLLGFDKEDMKDMAISANKAIVTHNEQAKAEWLDYKGEGVAVNNSILEKLEFKMREIGLNTIVSDGNTTAFEVSVATNQSQSKLDGYVRRLKDTAEIILSVCGLFYGLKDGGYVEIEADILKTPLTPQEALALNTMVMSGNMSQETMWKMIASGSLELPADFDEEIEKEKIGSEGLLSDGES